MVAFFRSMGGSVGVSALGAVLTHQVADTRLRRARRGWGPRRTRHESRTIPDLATLPAPFRALFEHAFGEATGHLFLVAVPFAVLALVCVLLIQEVPLRTTILRADELRARGGSRAAALGPTRPVTTTTPGRDRRCAASSTRSGVLIRRVRRASASVPGPSTPTCSRRRT